MRARVRVCVCVLKRTAARAQSSSRAPAPRPPPAASRSGYCLAAYSSRNGRAQCLDALRRPCSPPCTGCRCCTCPRRARGRLAVRARSASARRAGAAAHAHRLGRADHRRPSPPRLDEAATAMRAPPPPLRPRAVEIEPAAPHCTRRPRPGAMPRAARRGGRHDGDPLLRQRALHGHVVVSLALADQPRSALISRSRGRRGAARCCACAARLRTRSRSSCVSTTSLRRGMLRGGFSASSSLVSDIAPRARLRLRLLPALRLPPASRARAAHRRTALYGARFSVGAGAHRWALPGPRRRRRAAAPGPAAAGRDARARAACALQARPRTPTRARAPRCRPRPPADAAAASEPLAALWRDKLNVRGKRWSTCPRRRRRRRALAARAAGRANADDDESGGAGAAAAAAAARRTARRRPAGRPSRPRAPAAAAVRGRGQRRRRAAAGAAAAAAAAAAASDDDNDDDAGRRCCRRRRRTRRRGAGGWRRSASTAINATMARDMERQSQVALDAQLARGRGLAVALARPGAGGLGGGRHPPPKRRGRTPTTPRTAARSSPAASSTNGGASTRWRSGAASSVAATVVEGLVPLGAHDTQRPQAQRVADAKRRRRPASTRCSGPNKPWSRPTRSPDGRCAPCWATSPAARPRGIGVERAMAIAKAVQTPDVEALRTRSALRATGCRGRRRRSSPPPRLKGQPAPAPGAGGGARAPAAGPAPRRLRERSWRPTPSRAQLAARQPGRAKYRVARAGGRGAFPIAHVFRILLPRRLRDGAGRVGWRWFSATRCSSRTSRCSSTSGTGLLRPAPDERRRARRQRPPRRLWQRALQAESATLARRAASGRSSKLCLDRGAIRLGQPAAKWRAARGRCLARGADARLPARVGGQEPVEGASQRCTRTASASAMRCRAASPPRWTRSSRSASSRPTLKLGAGRRPWPWAPSATLCCSPRCSPRPSASTAPSCLAARSCARSQQPKGRGAAQGPGAPERRPR